MKEKNNDYIYDVEQKEFYGSNKIVFSKSDCELFDEAKNKPNKVYRVKRVELPNDGESWKIFENNKILFVVEGEKITNKEKEFLRSPNGIIFLMEQSKRGIKSLHNLRKEIKKNIKSAIDLKK